MGNNKELYRQIGQLILMVLAIPTMFILGIGVITFIVEVLFNLK